MTKSWVVGAGGFAPRFVSEDEAARGETGFEPLPSVASAVERVARALDGVGVRSAHPLLDPSFGKATEAWADVQDQAAGEPLIVHFSGHGDVLHGELYLAVMDSTQGSNLRRTALNVTTMLGDAEAGPAGPVLFLLDVCSAGTALSAQEFRKITDRERKAWVIAACGPGRTTFRARFSHATAQVLERLAKGWLDISPVLAHVPVDTFAAEIHRELNRGAGADDYPTSVVRTPTTEALLDPAPFFVNPAYAEAPAERYRARISAALWQLAAEVDPGLDPLHFVGRATGSQGTDRCLFTGRDVERERIARWLEDSAGEESNLLVVTGSAGSGKSALLGVTACLTHPQLAPLAGAVFSRVRDHRPRPAGRVLAVHARRQNGDQLIASLLRQLDGEPDAHHLPATNGTASAAGAATLETLRSRLADAGPVILILDALDEATDPEGLLEQVILPLADRGGDGPQPDCRFLIGTRPLWKRLPNLRNAALKPGSLLSLDTVPEKRLTKDLAGFLGDLLWNDRRYPDETLAALAAALAGAVDHGGFLLATLFADHLAQLPAETELTAEQVVERLPNTIAGMLDLHIDTLSRTDPWVRPVVAALGHARGRGMPLELLHVTAVALAPAQDPDRLPPDLDTTRQALDHASFYLRADRDTDGRQLYRFFHQSLAEHSAPPAGGAVLDALIAQVPADADGCVAWELAQPYLRRHAMEHAVAAGGGAVDRLLTDPGFLVHAEPAGLAPHLHLAGDPTAQIHASVYRTTLTHHPLRELPEARRQLLVLDALRWKQPALAEAVSSVVTTDRTVSPTPSWATGSLTNRALRHTLVHGDGVEEPVIADIDGRPHALTTSAVHGEGTVQVWDLADGNQRHSLRQFGGTSKRIHVLDILRFRGHAHAITQDEQDVIRAWNLTDGTMSFSTPEPRPEPRPEPASDEQGTTLTISVSLDSYASRVSKVFVSDGHLFAITTRDGGVQVWDMDCGHEHLELPVRPDGDRIPDPVGFLMTGGGVPLLLVGEKDRLTVWDLATGAAGLSVDTAPTRFNRERFSWLVAGDGKPFLFLKEETRLRIWDVGENSLVVDVPHHHDGYVMAVTDGSEGGPCLFMLDRSGTVTGWNLGSGPAPAEFSCAGDDGAFPLTARFQEIDDRLCLITVQPDRVRIWNVADGAPVAAFPVALVPDVWVEIAGTAVIEDDLHVAFLCFGVVQVWNVATGTLRHAFSHGDGVTRGNYSKDTATVAEVEDRPVIVTTAGDGVVRVWDLSAPTQLQEMLFEKGRVEGLGVVEAGGRRSALVIRERSMSLIDLATGRAGRSFDAQDSWRSERDDKPTVYIGSTHAAAHAPDHASIQVWNFVDGTERVHTAAGPVNIAMALADDRDHLVISAVPTGDGADGHVTVWDLGRNSWRSLKHTPADAGRTVVAIGSFGSRTFLLTTTPQGEERWWHVWNTVTGAEEGALLEPDLREKAQGLLAEMGDRIVAVTVQGGREVRIWDIADNGFRTTLTHPGDVEPCLIHVLTIEETHLVLTLGSDLSVRTWNAESGELLAVLDLHSLHEHPANSWLSLNYAEVDGRMRLVTLDKDGRAGVWDVLDLEFVKSLSLPGEPMRWLVGELPPGRPQLVVATDGRRGNGVTYLWDLASDTSEATQFVVTDPVEDVWLCPDGLVVAFGADLALFRTDGTAEP
ncbi:NACHT and WD repeat domain-containing protein [Kitasatospora mediocidica]|uniref:NACHT and WD repeat domain-containing protein n=1 Tax=Kitasatospora mediocidica TaxID=58352 RepID=UPI00055B8B97|nr:NACHT and WD repeat domain-containing protein [Kitasatospora mediocidica]